MHEEPSETDVAIIGAGPVGLFAIFQLGMLGMKAQVFDALDLVGGQCAALYPEKPIYDIPGYPRIDGKDLIDRLAEQAAPFQPVFRLGRKVTALTRRSGGGWRLETDAGDVVAAKAVIIAAGGGAFGPNRPPLAGIEDYEKTAVFYLVRRREDFRGKRIVIAGGGDSAVDWALSLAELAAHIYMVHRRARFRAAPESVARLHALADAGRIELVTPYQLAALVGEGGRLRAVIVETMDGEARRLEADTLLPFFGLAASLGPIAQWGVRVEGHQIVVDPATCETAMPGVFAVGDVAIFAGKLKLILSGFAEAAMAAHAIHGIVFPDRALHFEYSTTKGLPGQA